MRSLVVAVAIVALAAHVSAGPIICTNETNTLVITSAATTAATVVVASVACTAGTVVVFPVSGGAMSQ